MKTYKLFWSPEGRCIATVTARDARTAIRKAPQPYRKALGEIYAEEVQATKATVTFKREEMDDDSPDLSWLDQSDKEMGEGFEAQSRERLAAYKRGDWHMIGIRAKASIIVQRPGHATHYELTSSGLWGIESDSDEAYLNEVFADECAELRADIEALKTAEFK